MTCLNCGCPREIHRHNHRRTYCGHCITCNHYRPWWWLKITSWRRA